MMKELTKAEERLWQKEKALVKDIMEEFPEPKPAYDTISTILCILKPKDLLNIKHMEKPINIFL